jgi:peptidyl-prolyl cis-trans isomerase D
MVNLLRKHQQFLMIVITFLVIIAFVWLYNGTSRTQYDRLGTDRVGKIYGRTVSQADLDRDVRRFEVARSLQLIDLLSGLIGQATSRDQAVENFVWNSRVLNHEAEILCIQPTNDEVVAKVKRMPVFQTNGQFDSQKYAEFVQQTLSPRGFTETQLEDLMRDELRLEKVRALIDSTVDVSPSDFRAAYEKQYQKLVVSLVSLHREDFAKSLQIVDDDIRKRYDQKKDEYKSEEKRRVSIASFLLPETAKSLTGRERVDELQKIANQANEFTQALLDKNAQFAGVAAKYNVPVKSTGLFTEATPDPAVGSNPALVSAAFSLSSEDPNSDVVQSENGFYVLHLDEVVTSKPLSFEEARPQIVAQITRERSSEMMALKAGEIRARIVAAMNEGKTFAEAATATGQKPESFPPFSPAEPNVEKPNAREVMGRAMELAEGSVSEFVPSTDGGILICLEKRQPIDEAKFEQDKASLGQNFAKGKRDLVFREWLRQRREAAKIQFASS